MKSLLLISILLPTTIVTSTPVPSSSSTPAPSIIEGERSIEVGSYLVQTISPTIDIVSLTGHETPTKITTLKPTFSPTNKGDGLDVEILIPGVSNNAAGEGGDDGGDKVATSSAVGDNEEVEAIPTYTPTYYPTAKEPEADQGLAFAGANTAMEGDNANGVIRLGSSTTIALLGSVVAVVGGLMAIR